MLGIGDACRMFDTPVTGGNVSFYNESNLGAVYPTPVIGMVGVIEDNSKIVDLSYKTPGDMIVSLGSINGSLGGSEYLKQVHGIVQGPIPSVDLEIEKNLQDFCLDTISKGVIKSAHDISDGGLAVNIAESVCNSEQGIGAEIYIERKLRTDEILFGECQGVIIVTINAKDLDTISSLGKKYKIYTQTLGHVTDDSKLTINDDINIKRKKFEDCYFNSLNSIINQN